MSLSKAKNGIIVIPLLIILFISIGVLAMSKSIVNSQASVSTAIDSRFQNPSIFLSTFMDPPAKWEKYQNKAYFYIVKFPKQWPASTSKAERGDLSTYTRFLSNKIILKVRVLAKHQYPQEASQVAIGKNTFYFSPRQADLRSAALSHGKYYYVLELSQDNYFADGKEFDSVFLNILKNLEFTNPQS